MCDELRTTIDWITYNAMLVQFYPLQNTRPRDNLYTARGTRGDDDRSKLRATDRNTLPPDDETAADAAKDTPLLEDSGEGKNVA